MGKMISLTDQGAFLASDNITAQEYINITLNTQLNLFRELVKQGADKEQLYDLYNQSASAFLSTFVPDKELRPDVTAEAIMATEDAMLKERTKHVDIAPEELKTKIRDNIPVIPVDPDNNLIPLDSLDKDGKPRKPVHKK